MVMDSEPLLFHVQLGALRPASAAAEEAVRAIKPGSHVRIEIKQARGNIMRLRWYWKMLRLFLDNKPDAFDAPVTPTILHRWLKVKFGLSKPIHAVKTGEIVGYQEGSIAFHNMPESERAPFVDASAAFLSKSLGVDVATLRAESGE